jgi:hypothetical protein
MPELVARLLATLGAACRRRGAYRWAERLTRRPGASIALLNERGVVCKAIGRHNEARACYDRALVLLASAGVPEDARVATLLHNVGGIEHARGRHADGEPFARRAVALRARLLGPEHVAVAADAVAHAALLEGLGRLDEAAAVVNECSRTTSPAP